MIVDYLHDHPYQISPLHNCLSKHATSPRHRDFTAYPRNAQLEQFSQESQNPDLLQQSKADVRQYGWAGHPIRGAMFAIRNMLTDDLSTCPWNRPSGLLPFCYNKCFVRYAYPAIGQHHLLSCCYPAG